MPKAVPFTFSEEKSTLPPVVAVVTNMSYADGCGKQMRAWCVEILVNLRLGVGRKQNVCGDHFHSGALPVL